MTPDWMRCHAPATGVKGDLACSARWPSQGRKHVKLSIRASEWMVLCIQPTVSRICASMPIPHKPHLQSYPCCSGQTGGHGTTTSTVVPYSRQDTLFATCDGEQSTVSPPNTHMRKSHFLLFISANNNVAGINDVSHLDMITDVDLAGK